MALLDVRDHFDMPADRAYLNAAYMGPLPIAAVEAGRRALEAKSHPWTVPTSSFFEPVDHLRELLAGFLDGDGDGVAIVPSVSYGVATIAANVDIPAGSRIITLAEQFPSNVYSWRAAATSHDAEIVVVEKDESGWTAPVLAALDERTSVVAVEVCHWTDGSVLDLVAIGKACRDVGATYIVDVSQSLGAVPFPIGDIAPDYVVGVLYKWMLGAYGISFLWCAPHCRDGNPLEHAWPSRAGSEDFSQLVHYTDKLRPGARRFDMGEVGNHVNVATTAVSVDLLASWNPARIAEHARELTSSLVERASPLGLTAPPEHHRSPHLIGLHLPAGGPEPATVAAALADASVHVSIRGTAVRVSAHAFNTMSDVDRLIDALGAAL